MPALEDAIQYIRMGNREQGRQILEEILETEESNEDVWLWLSSVVESDEDREICLENVLAINPNNGVARRGLDALRAGTFNANDLLSEVLDQQQDKVESTFLDDFAVSSDEAVEELELPSTMAKSKPKAKAKKKSKRGGGINPRLIILVALVLVVVLVLGGIAAFTLLSGGEGGGVEATTPAENPPTQPQEPAAAPPTDTPVPTPLPTDTPVPTATRFQLPTPEPTTLPSPTATRVVSPTPQR
jgi:hypothetical protein